MDDKARFQKIQTQLERLLYEYKNSFPKNIWQVIGVDIPIVTLAVSIFVIIRLMGISIWSLIIIVLMVLPFILMWSTQSNSIWTKIWKKRKTYLNDNKAILGKISKIETSEFEQYPDVKRYLENYQSELSAETARKEGIQKRYKTILFIGGILLLAGAVLTFTKETKLKSFQDKHSENTSQQDTYQEIRNIFIHQDGFIKYLNLADTVPVATIAPLSFESCKVISTTEEDTINRSISIYFREGDKPVFTMRMPKMYNTDYEKDYIYRLIITDTTGRPVNDLPFFDFSDNTKKYKPIPSYSITFNNESHPYEVVKRVKYLQENAAYLRYTIELLKTVPHKYEIECDENMQ